MATDLAGPGYHINRSNLLVLESKEDMQKRGQASPDDGDALALTFAQAVAPAEVEERDEDEEIIGGDGTNGPGAWVRSAPPAVPPRSREFPTHNFLRLSALRRPLPSHR